MKIDLNKQTFTKEEVIGILDDVQDKIIDLWSLHERYGENSSEEAKKQQDIYITAYREANRILVNFKNALKI
jgi:hypothetical protein